MRPFAKMKCEPSTSKPHHSYHTSLGWNLHPSDLRRRHIQELEYELRWVTYWLPTSNRSVTIWMIYSTRRQIHLRISSVNSPCSLNRRQPSGVARRLHCNEDKHKENHKFETRKRSRGPKQIQLSKKTIKFKTTSIRIRGFGFSSVLGLLGSDFVSNLDLRISDFALTRG